MAIPVLPTTACIVLGISLIVPKSLHGVVVSYKDNAELGTWRVEYSMYEFSKAVAYVEGTFSA